MKAPPASAQRTTPRPQVSVVVPAHNEVMLIGTTLTNLVTGLEKRGRSFEVIVVENGSRDGTLRLSRLLAAQLPSIRVSSLPRADYGDALAHGLRLAAGEVVATFDADYYDFGFFDDAYELIERDDADVVVASKRARGASDRRSRFRRLLTAGFALTTRTLVGLELSDAHGMKLFRTAAIRPLVDQTVSRGSLFDVELATRASRGGLRIRELPAVVHELRPPRSSVLRRTFESMAGLARLRVVLGSDNAIGSKPRRLASLRPPGDAGWTRRRERQLSRKARNAR
ncbi:MAG: glycosyltransferase family 2 protein [Acidimicrobiales bacterium]